MSTNTPPVPDEPAQDASTSEIQADIDTTRAELGETVEQLSGRLDVKSQAKQKAGQYRARGAQIVEAGKGQVNDLTTAAGNMTRRATDSDDDPAAIRGRGGIALGSGGLLACALIAGVLVWRHKSKSHRPALRPRRGAAKQLRRARKKTSLRKRKH